MQAAHSWRELVPTLLLAGLLATTGIKAADAPNTGRIAGRVGEFPKAEGQTPVRVQAVELFANGAPRPSAVATPNDAGEFTFEAVPKGRILLHPVLVDSEGRNMSNPSALRAPGIVRAGETLRVDLFGKGRPVTGRLTLPQHIRPEQCRVELTYLAPPFRLLTDGRNPAPGWTAYLLLAQKKPTATVNADGRFRFENVRSGNYRLAIMRTVDGNPVTLQFDRAIEKDRWPDRVTVWLMSDEENDKPQDLGTSAWVER